MVLEYRSGKEATIYRPCGYLRRTFKGIKSHSISYGFIRINNKLQRPDVLAQPLPPIRHRIWERSLSATPSTSGATFAQLGLGGDNQLSTISRNTIQ